MHTFPHTSILYSLHVVETGRAIHVQVQTRLLTPPGVERESDSLISIAPHDKRILVVQCIHLRHKSLNEECSTGIGIQMNTTTSIPWVPYMYTVILPFPLLDLG